MSDLEVIRPIQTSYAGHRFRSRLEARYAVFFDRVGWHWEYEPEGFHLPSGDYLPDFLVSTRGIPNGMWVEVKPEPTAAQDIGTLSRDGAGFYLDPRWVDLARMDRGRSVQAWYGLPRPGRTWHQTVVIYWGGDRLQVAHSGHPAPAAYEPALEAARSARFEHHATDPTALR